MPFALLSNVEPGTMQKGGKSAAVQGTPSKHRGNCRVPWNTGWEWLNISWCGVKQVGFKSVVVSFICYLRMAGLHLNAVWERHVLAPQVNVRPFWEACRFQWIVNGIQNVSRKHSAFAATRLHSIALLALLFPCSSAFCSLFKWMDCQNCTAS